MNTPIYLSDTDRSTITTALRLAADIYDLDAIRCSNAGSYTASAEFSYRADRARVLAGRIENVGQE